MMVTSPNRMFRNTLIGFLLYCALAAATQQAVAQSAGEQQKIAELEQLNAARKQQEMQSALDSAILLVQQGAHLQADARLTALLRKVKAVPSDLAYYFGENSFHLGKYRQSIDWLTKYVQLKGTTGKHSADAVLYLKKSEDALLAENRQRQQEAVEIFSRDFDIDCGPAGKVVCPVCNGKTVIVKRDYLADKFSTCPYCDKHGFLSCEQYNLLLRGQLKKQKAP